MELRTKMVGPDSTSAGPYPAARESDDGQDYLHDAAAAHALMQALGEMCNDCTGVISERAADILASWGFDDKVTP